MEITALGLIIPTIAPRNMLSPGFYGVQSNAHNLKESISRECCQNIKGCSLQLNFYHLHNLPTSRPLILPGDVMQGNDRGRRKRGSDFIYIYLRSSITNHQSKLMLDPYSDYWQLYNRLIGSYICRIPHYSVSKILQSPTRNDINDKKYTVYSIQYTEHSLNVLL